MQRGFSSEVRRVIGFSGVCFVAGLIVGQLAWTLVLGGTLYIAWTLYQIYRLEQWLQSSKRQAPPDAAGIWGEIFDRIFRLQRRQRQEKRRLQSFVIRIQEATAALKDAVIMLDGRGNLDWWNQSAHKLLGFLPADQGQPIVNYIRNPQFIRYFEGGDYKQPLTIYNQLNEGRCLQYQVTVYGNSEYLIVVRDITHLHKLEQMRKDFVANVSHELRTPLTVIRGYLETFIDSDAVPATWQRALGQMEQQTDRMTLLIQDLLTLTKLETEDSQKNQEAIDISQLLQQIAADARALSGDKQQNINVRCQQPLTILGNKQELQSAISNLVFNAVKYSPASATINLSSNIKNGHGYVSVEDNGIGIDPKHIPRLTERFYRIDSSRSQDTGGTGLGLAIVKHVLLRHNSQLLITSKLHKGSTFTCEFPPQRLLHEEQTQNISNG